MSEHELSQLERLTRLEIQQEANVASIQALSGIVERLTRVEERQQSVARFVYGGGALLGTAIVAIVVYLAQLVIGGA